MVNPNKFYTYAYLREDKTPYYIGKGKGDRAYKKSKNDIKPPKDKSRILLLKQNLTEAEAFRHEIYMIFLYGRNDLGTGILRNKTDGGDGVSGWVPSDKTRKRMSEAKIGETHSEESKIKMSEAHKGKTHSEETRRKLSEASKGKTPSEETRKKLSDANRGENNPNYGKTPSEETRRKLSETSKGRTHSEETKRNISEAKKGKTHSEETKIKMSEAKKGNTSMLGKTHSEETKIKMSEQRKGLRWWNDGCGNCKMMIECPGDGWKLGRKSGKL